jgi:hypothetical protein
MTTGRVAYSVAALLFLSGLTHALVLLATGGSWQGPMSLRKAATFGLSFGLTLGTIAWTSSFLPLREKIRNRLLVIFMAACVLETALVSLQAWRGVPSHFNMETRFDAAVAQSLAAGGATLVAIIVIMTLAAFRHNAAVPPSFRIGLRVGFVTMLISLAVGALMIARGVGLVIAGNAPQAYATGGVLKPSHAVTMHGILVLPVLAWLLSLTDWTEARRVRIVRLASLVYLLIVIVTIAANFTSVI